MKVSALNYQNNYNTNFKSTFPVVHWVRESNGSFAPVAQEEIVKYLQRQIVNFLNNKSLLTKSTVNALKSEAHANKTSASSINRKLKEVMNATVQKFISYICWADADYRTAKLKPKVHSFYNSYNSNDYVGGPSNLLYIATGRHAAAIDKLGAEIGRRTRENNEFIAEKIAEITEQYNELLNTVGNTEGIREKYRREIEAIKKTEIPALTEAKKRYHTDGLRYVNYYPRRIKDQNGNTQVLHTKFEIIRDKDGKFLDYKFLDARFLPEFGPNSPFERLKN